MQKVAAYALVAPMQSVSAARARFDAVVALVKDWRDQKGALRETDGTRELVLKDGRVATYSDANYVVAEGRAADLVLVEPAHSAMIRTQVSVGIADKRVAVFVEIQAAGGAYQLGPMKVDIRCPVIVRSIAQAYEDWTVGDSPISASPYSFLGAEGADRLAAVIWHPQRNLPVVVASSYEGSFLTESFPRELATDLVGVAIVGTLDAEGSWALTKMKGKEWSCFNGAVRMYWPLGTAKDEPTSHPLWMRTSLHSHVATPNEASSRFRRQLRQQLLGLSAFAVPEPDEINLVRSAHQRAAADEVRAQLMDNNDWKGLADLYAKSNEELKEENEDQRAKLRDLGAVVAQLQKALQWSPQSEQDVTPERFLPPSTVGEAVDVAKSRFKYTLRFGNDVASGLATLAPDAGPPEKILKYLEQLSEMVQLRQGAGLGQAPVKWLQSRGVDASGESLTVRNSQEERRKRTWHDGTADRVFELHLKPNEAVHPDRCVRIYFDYDEVDKIALVGWVGRHP